MSDNDTEDRGAARDSTRNTLLVALGLSLVCSVLVAGTAVVLKPVQEQNEDRFRQRIVLEVAGLMEPGADIEQLFASVEPRMVELATGAYVETPAPADFDAQAAAADAELGVAIPPGEDLAGIRRRARYAPVYLVEDGGGVQQIILPVYGKGLWSTMYGYLAVAGDGNTILGLRFYEHAETPGLGDQVDKPDWRRLWQGKQIYGDDGMPRIHVVRGSVQGDESDAAARFEVDGLSGATLTGRGVTHLIQYWTGPHGFGPYLDKFRNRAGAAQ